MSAPASSTEQWQTLLGMLTSLGTVPGNDQQSRFIMVGMKHALPVTLEVHKVTARSGDYLEQSKRRMYENSDVKYHRAYGAFRLWRWGPGLWLPTPPTRTTDEEEPC